MKKSELRALVKECIIQEEDESGGKYELFGPQNKVRKVTELMPSLSSLSQKQYSAILNALAFGLSFKDMASLAKDIRK